MTMTAADFVAEARQQIREIDPHDYARAREDHVLIDVREPAEFETGHIAGAINIPRGVLEFQVDAHPAVANTSDPALAHRRRRVVVYCRTGGRAALATQALQRMGFTDAASIAGGIVAWREAGLPVGLRA